MIFRHSWSWLLYSTIILLGIGLRIFVLRLNDAWLDEAFTGWMVHQSWPNLFQLVSKDVHPFVYPALLKIWAGLWGTDILALRTFSLLFGIAILPLTYSITQLLFQKRSLALLSMFLVAINPFLVDYSVEARSYALVCFLGLLSVWYLLKAIQDPTGQYNIYWFWFGIYAAVNFLTHLFSLFFTITLLLFSLFYYRSHYKTIVATLSKSMIPLLITMIAWLPIVFTYRVAAKTGFWILPVDISILPLSIYRYCFGVYRQMPGMPTERLLTLPVPAIIIGLVLLIILVSTFFIKAKRSRYDSLILLGWLGPLLGAIAANYAQNYIYVERFFIMSSVFLMLNFALLVWRIPKVVGVPLVLLYCVGVGGIFVTTFSVDHSFTEQLNPEQQWYTDPATFILAQYYLRNDQFKGKLLTKNFSTVDEAYTHYEPWIVIPKESIVLTKPE